MEPMTELRKPLSSNRVFKAEITRLLAMRGGWDDSHVSAELNRLLGLQAREGESAEPPRSPISAEQSAQTRREMTEGAKQSQWHAAQRGRR
jgi:hypothetical protein